ncbi:MAG: hypothetical protein ACYC1H_01145 [Rectinema subterraneum]|jgi:hypothetical protein
MRGRKKYFFDIPRMAAAGAKRKSYIFRALLFASFAFSSFLMFSCGTPSAEYLRPPYSFTNESGILRLVHESLNIDDTYISSLFKGYEIYYHVFDGNSESAAAADISYLKSISTYNPAYFISNATAAGYYPLLKRIGNSQILTNRPLIPVTNNTYSEFDLNMSTNSTWSIAAYGSDASNTAFANSVVRNSGDAISVDTRDFSFSSYYHANDQDYTGSDSPNPVYIVFFAVSYGISAVSLGNALYSEPVIIDAPVKYTPNS